MKSKKWNILSTFSSDLSLSHQLLSNRGISDTDKFLNPPRSLDLVKNFSNEFKKSLLDAKKLILDEIARGTTIIIYGDYDADGVCATAILYKTITRELGHSRCFYFIPNRFEHGYGLSEKALKDIYKTLFSLDPQPRHVLFITVDTGITAISETKNLKALGYKLIITDHHQKPAELPAADLIVWNDKIVGSTISWLLSKVLGSKDVQNTALAALATITDLQPLLDFNRSLVKEGLEVMNSNPPIGLKTLLELAGKTPTEITTYDIGFVIGPRLNASGRIQSANESLELLLATDIATITTLAQALNETNTKRQDKTLEMYDVAAAVEKDGHVPRIIISADANYHEGIIGLVASKMVGKYYRPSIVIALTEEYGKGSVRSIPGIDIIAVLRQFDHLFLNLGGHPMAAGFTISLENLETLKIELEKYFNETFTDSHFEPSIDIDMEIPLSKVTYETAGELSGLKPFGVGNKEPVFCTRKVQIAALNKVGKDNTHLSLKLSQGGVFNKAIFFGGGSWFGELNLGDVIDIAYSMKQSEFNGNRTADIIIQDIRV
jgi:single-stranded-DNA-specific exonuclease